MDNWQVFLVISALLGFIVAIVTPILKITGVIQKNTIAIQTLTNEIKDLTIHNKEDHDHFFNSINKINQEVAVLKEKHRK